MPGKVSEKKGRLGQKGMSLVEIMVALVIASFIIIFAFFYYHTQSQSFNVQDQVSQAQGEARLALKMVTTRLVNVGVDPTRGPGIARRFGVIPGWAGVPEPTSAAVIIWTQDTNDNGLVEPEDVRGLKHSGGTLYELRYQDGAFSWAPFLAGLDGVSFTYFNAGGGQIYDPVAQAGQVRAVGISVTALTAKPDPTYAGYPDGYRRRNLSSSVTLHNMSFN